MMKKTLSETKKQKSADSTVYVCLLVLVLMGLSLFSKEPFGWHTLRYALLGVLLLAISIIDYRSFIIPDELLIAALVLYVPLSLLAGDSFLQIGWHLTLQGVLASLPLLLFVLAADYITGMETMGFGDIKLFYVLGVYMGAQYAWLTLFVACIVALLWNVLLLRGKKNQPFPFGPSISAAAWLVIIWGRPVLEWYIQLWM